MTGKIKVNLYSFLQFINILSFIMLMFICNSLYAQVVRGRLIDTETNEPVKEVLVYLMPSKDKIAGIQVSDSLGYFYFNNVSYHSFYIKTDRLGYNDIIFGKLIMPQNDTLSIIFKMVPVPIVLKEVPVVADKPDFDYSPRLESVGFYRRKEMDWGKFYTREDFKYRNPVSTTDLFRGMPGIIVSNGNIFSTRPGGLWGKIPMRIYVDGALLLIDPTLPYSNLDSTIPPQVITAVEVYRSSTTAPAQYSSPYNTSGVILIWTGK